MSEFKINTEKAPELFTKLHNHACCDLSVADWELSGYFDAVSVVIQRSGDELKIMAHIFAGIRDSAVEGGDCYALSLPYEFLLRHPESGCYVGGLYACPQSEDLYCKIVKTNVISFQDKQYLIRSQGKDIVLALGEIGDPVTFSTAKRFFEDLREFCEILSWLLNALHAIYGQDIPDEEFMLEELAFLGGGTIQTTAVFSENLGFKIFNFNKEKIFRHRKN